MIQDSFISARCCWRATGQVFNLVTVYGPQAVPDKLLFLQHLKPHCTTTSPALLVGDFNLILQASDKSTNNFNRRTMMAFRRFTNEMELHDIYLHGRRYTWSNEQADAIKVKLDRALMNEGWENEHPNCVLQALPSDLSDHCPLLLSTDAMFTPPRHFRFENYWMGLDGFEETVTRSWTQGTSCSDPFLIMHCKMTRLSRELKRWNSQVVGDMKLRSAMTSELIGRLDRAMDARQLTDAERQFRNMLKLNLLGIAAVQR
jgi:hypothetical protein